MENELIKIYMDRNVSINKFPHMIFRNKTYNEFTPIFRSTLNALSFIATESDSTIAGFHFGDLIIYD
jgi:hypothetical protein